MVVVRLTSECARYGPRAPVPTKLDPDRLQQRLKVLTHPALLSVDEIRRDRVRPHLANRSHALLPARQPALRARLGRASPPTRASTSGARILGDEVMATALIDRLLHRCHTVNIRGNSYRMRQHVDLFNTLRNSSPSKETETSP